MAGAIHWFAGHPAEPLNGVCGQRLADDPGYSVSTGTGACLGELRLRIEEIDEHLLTLFVPRAAEVDQDKDSGLASLARILTETINVHTAATFALEKHP